LGKRPKSQPNFGNGSGKKPFSVVNPKTPISGSGNGKSKPESLIKLNLRLLNSMRRFKLELEISYLNPEWNGLEK